MQLFVLTEHCKSKKHCRVCRNKEAGRKWRASLQTIFKLPDDQVDFECPYGMEWGDIKTPALAPIEPVPETPKPKKPEMKIQVRPDGSRVVSKRGCGCSRS